MWENSIIFRINLQGQIQSIGLMEIENEFISRDPLNFFKPSSNLFQENFYEVLWRIYEKIKNLLKLAKKF
jgi:hypothetical protein